MVTQRSDLIGFDQLQNVVQSGSMASHTEQISHTMLEGTGCQDKSLGKAQVQQWHKAKGYRKLHQDLTKMLRAMCDDRPIEEHPSDVRMSMQRFFSQLCSLNTNFCGPLWCSSQGNNKQNRCNCCTRTRTLSRSLTGRRPGTCGAFVIEDNHEKIAGF